MANNRPIGFELHGGHGQQGSNQQGQPPYGYPPINTTPGYGAGYGAAYPPEVVAGPEYQHQIDYSQAGGGYQQGAPVPYMPNEGRSFTPPVEPRQRQPDNYPPSARQPGYVPREVTVSGHGSRPGSGQTRETNVSRNSGISGGSLLRNDEEDGEKEDYRETQDDADNIYFRDGIKKIDYVLSYQKSTHDDPNRVKNEERRKEYEKNLKRAGLELEYEDNTASSDGMTYFIKVHAPLPVLYKGAELMHMKMPIRKNDLASESFSNKVYKQICCCRNPFALHADDIPEEENYFTCPFHRDRKDEFKDIDTPDFFTNAQRSIIVHRYLMKCKYGNDKLYIGINRMVSKGCYTAAYPIHEGEHKSRFSILTHKPSNDRQLLYYHWARFTNIFKEQPLDLIRKYFGEKIGLYFSWLGFYTVMLVPAAILGVCSIIYGMATMDDYTSVKEICKPKNGTSYPMCPKCNTRCPYWPLSESCMYSKIAYVLDNPFTVVFAIFMSFWATCFLEIWKRKQSEISYDWDLIGFEDEEEQPRAEYENKLLAKGEHYRRTNPITDLEEPYIRLRKRFPKYICGFYSVLFMVCLVVAAMMGVIVYRVAVTVTLAKTQNIKISWISLFASFTAAMINLICIMILNKIHQRVAFFLTKWELPRTQTNFDDSYTFKMYLFQFVNFYGSLFYIAFFKLDPGYPGHYNTIFGYRREECNPAGCLFELGVQLFVIMVGKQVFNTFIEVFIPKIKNWCKRRKTLADEEVSHFSRWDKDSKLTEISPQGLFEEYLEMVIQFGFITIFVAAFPLGPFFALLNNLIEIRVDAYKFVVLYRRPLAQKAQDIGIWYSILDAVVKLSVIVNAFVIAFVSEFVQRLYYQFAISRDQSLNGFIANTLSCFDVRDFPSINKPAFDFNNGNKNGSCGFGMPTCRVHRGPLVSSDLLVQAHASLVTMLRKWETAFSQFSDADVERGME